MTYVTKLYLAVFITGSLLANFSSLPFVVLSITMIGMLMIAMTSKTIDLNNEK